MNELETDLQNLADKHKLVNWSFCGSRLNKFVGIIEPFQNLEKMTLTVANSARQYQFTRQVLFEQFDRIAK